MRGNAHEFVADPPGQKPRRRPATRPLDQFPAGYVEFAVGLGRVQKHLGVEDEHVEGSVLTNPLLQGIAVGHVDERATTLPLR